MNTEKEISKAINFGFVNSQVESQEIYQPSLVTNQNDTTVLATLEDELRTSRTFTIAVAFVTTSGLIDLKSVFTDLAHKNIHGRLITSTYLNFNDPEAFEDLLQIKNLDVHLLDKDGFHTKAYYFDHGNFESAIIGSANLTQNALKSNFEWNLRVTSTQRGEVVNKIKSNLDDLWEKSTSLTSEWVENYRLTWKPNKSIQYFQVAEEPEYQDKTPTPNPMQTEALAALTALRDQENAKKALVVAATGTGKTYLAAFDVQNFKPKRMLYIVHREQILQQAMHSFKKVLGGSESDYGILSGSQHNLDCKYTFATVNMISSQRIQEQFGPDAFDYILIDEAHRVSQRDDDQEQTMYQKVLNFYQPEFLLGMTATPERTDGTNVYEYFDYNLAYENSLLDALDHDLLSPFHYIGVTDYEKDAETITDTSSLKDLVSEERVDYIVDKTNYYGPRQPNVHGLIFVSKIAEGIELAKKLVDRGIKAEFVYSKNSIAEREQAVRRLEDGEISYILTVDIFNEGVDIQCLNQIVMMRPTKSSIIFLQQLGRGLRKAPGKEFVTVLDFIGNYNENYMIPMAFDKSHSSNKEQIRKQIISPSIRGVSTINFEEIAKKRVLKAVGQAKLDSMKRFKEAYDSVKNKIGRIPMLIDFARRGNVNVADIISKFKTMYLMQQKFEKEFPVEFNAHQQKFLLFLSREIAVSKRPVESLILQELIQKQRLTTQQVTQILDQSHVFYDEETLTNVASIFDLSYFMNKNQEKYGEISIVDTQNDSWQLSETFNVELADPNFKHYVLDLLAANLFELQRDGFALDQRFTIGKKYYRSDVIKLLNWYGEQNAQNVGGYIMRPDQKFFPVFIALEKTEKFQNKMAYEDQFIDHNTMRWFSKSGRTVDSRQESIVLNQPDFGMIQLFVKKSDDDKREGNDFYYLGSARVTSAENEKKFNSDGKETKLVNFTLKLEHSVNVNLYRALNDNE
ncbi:helicase [Ligilactobacillus pabuli]|uniref:Helicase n=1 Tax=Ligilactobacillus pabuli TaxID=2886039 RepID=A0ABQ5JKU3_9LACO|nr:DEAD/DEAH box helicase [Ligilactobacillus pabuli]GKS81749.1 helicase [Ligilactobacillus pabuli]